MLERDIEIEFILDGRISVNDKEFYTKKLHRYLEDNFSYDFEITADDELLYALGKYHSLEQILTEFSKNNNALFAVQCIWEDSSIEKTYYLNGKSQCVQGVITFPECTLK